MHALFVANLRARIQVRRGWYPHLIWLLYAGLLYPCAAVRPPSTLVGSPLGGLDDSSFTPLCDLGSLPPASLDELDNPARGVLGIPRKGSHIAGRSSGPGTAASPRASEARVSREEKEEQEVKTP